ncbi:ion channel [Puia dinghuensis]|uniref:Inward rectifier potassium channel Irk n=1 Tax=Puia dinghuensis TaxID=1792502 RepID=A0A8J2UCY1_9BACT|nr:ion channel [Puia dinghuensis]GGA99291.1 inward rectifier potassium channel Irk [Puia dinghuensis]
MEETTVKHPRTFSRKIDPLLKTNNDTGFGTNAANYGGRFINRDGTFNLRKEGMAFLDRFSIYHSMLSMPRWKFVGLILVAFFAINVFYTSLYLAVGVDQLGGVIATTPWGKIKEAFFFSAETVTTVGYGRVNPVGDAANVVAAIEALSGWLAFALATGLIFGRFSRPRSFLVFSEFAVVSPFKDKTALMFRFAPYKDKHTLTDVQIRVNIGLKMQKDGSEEYVYYDLSLERTKVESLPLNWTVVHPIDEQSPLLGFSPQDMEAADVELYVLIRGFDDVYSNFVQQRTSFTYQEIKFNRKFIPMYRESLDGKTTILELHKLNEYEELKQG